MGTSSDFGGGRGQAWTGLRRASTQFGKEGGDKRAARVLARFVETLGGAVAAAAGAAAGAGVRTAQQVGSLGAGIAASGLSDTLQDLGLGHLVGASRFDVVEGLLDALAGPGDALEEQAARTAACDVLDDLFADAETYEELQGIVLDAGAVAEILHAFLAAYIFARLAPALDERLNRLGDSQLARRRERELRDYTRAVIRLELQGRDPLTVDWAGSEGRTLVEAAMLAVFEQLEALDQ